METRTAERTETKADQEPERLLQAALSYAKRGWYVIPCNAEKAPIGELVHHGLLDASRDPAMIRRWWTREPTANIGISCGPSHLVAIDVDVKDGKPGLTNWIAILDQNPGIDATLTEHTPSGGIHYIYQANGHEIPSRQNNPAMGIDVKAMGGYIVAAPSRTAKGLYKWDVADPDTAIIADLPEELAELLTQPTTERKPATIREGKPGDVERARAALERLAPWRCDNYEPWVNVGMALCELGAAGLDLWDTWSSESGKYKPFECAEKWDSFVPGEGITLASLFHWVNEDNPAPKSPDVPEEPEGLMEAPFTEDSPIGETTTHPRKAAPKARTYKQHVIDLHRLGYAFRLNRVTDKLEINGRPMDDPTLAKLRSIMRDKGFTNSMAFEDTLWRWGLEYEYHPIRDYLNKCGANYNGHDTIEELASYFTDITTPHPLFDLWLRRWLIGAVAKTMHDGDVHNAMLVLDGPQLAGKSYFASWLASGTPGYFLQAGINPEDKDCFVRYTDKFIWETGELGATTRRADIDALKDFISKETVNVRRPYGKYDLQKPALASLIGTINNSGGFLADTTGNRRFLVSHIASIDWDYSTKVDVNQVWAEAVTAYGRGERWIPDAEELELSEANNEIYMLPNPLESYLEKGFIIDPTDIIGWTATGDIVAALFEAGYRAQNARTLSMEIATTLARMAIKKYRKVTANGYQSGYLGVTRK